MHAPLAHLQINVDPANMPFYKDLAGFLGWQAIYDGDGILGISAGGAEAPSLWFVPQMQPAANDYDGPGMNHIAFRASSVADVDATVAYLHERSIPTLFETPRHRPEFAASPEATYYQVMFATPDRLLVEVVFTGPK